MARYDSSSPRLQPPQHLPCSLQLHQTDTLQQRAPPTSLSVMTCHHLHLGRVSAPQWQQKLPSLPHSQLSQQDQGMLSGVGCLHFLYAGLGDASSQPCDKGLKVPWPPCIIVSKELSVFANRRKSGSQCQSLCLLLSSASDERHPLSVKPNATDRLDHGPVPVLSR